MRIICGILYRLVIKKILFLFSADSVHVYFLHLGKRIGNGKLIKNVIQRIWKYEDNILKQNICCLNFKNPIGLAAGFDYNADLIGILPSIGFGFHTVGTLTYESYMGNPPPMLGRLPKSRSLLVNKGFKNRGVVNVLRDFPDGKREIPLGVSIGATNKVYPDFKSMISDLVKGFEAAESYKYFDYYELNISCPNVINVKNLDDQIDSPSGLKKALIKLSLLKLGRPIFIKMPLEKTPNEIKQLVEVVIPFAFIKGLIFSNLAKDRNNPAFDSEEIKKAGKGNFSGKPLEDKSNDNLRFAYKNYQKRFILIGVGGIFTAEDAYNKILCGASLVQLVTGMIYMGPQQIGVINYELAELLRKDGYKNIKEAVGTHV